MNTPDPMNSQPDVVNVQDNHMGADEPDDPWNWQIITSGNPSRSREISKDNVQMHSTGSLPGEKNEREDTLPDDLDERDRDERISDIQTPSDLSGQQQQVPYYYSYKFAAWQENIFGEDDNDNMMKVQMRIKQFPDPSDMFEICFTDLSRVDFKGIEDHLDVKLNYQYVDPYFGSDQMPSIHWDNIQLTPLDLLRVKCVTVLLGPLMQQRFTIDSNTIRGFGQHVTDRLRGEIVFWLEGEGGQILSRVNIPHKVLPAEGDLSS